MGAPKGNNNADGPHKHHGGRKKGSHIVHHKAHGNKSHKGHKGHHGHHGGHHGHHAQDSAEKKQ